MYKLATILNQKTYLKQMIFFTHCLTSLCFFSSVSRSSSACFSLTFFLFLFTAARLINYLYLRVSYFFPSIFQQSLSSWLAMATQPRLCQSTPPLTPDSREETDSSMSKSIIIFSQCNPTPEDILWWTCSFLSSLPL